MASTEDRVEGLLVIGFGLWLLFRNPEVVLIKRRGPSGQQRLQESLLRLLTFPFLMHLLLLMLHQILIPFQELGPALVAVKLLHPNSLLEAVMVDEVPAEKSPEEDHSSIPTVEANDIISIEL